ncbi:hypothetical protein ACFPOE_13445 [Caenimonas terrae]|uniref:Uncharacterized protein n=1 Tax=Caenimonas terrae TaxID=696074 RepID=A0ABW0ND13_9BURK
MNDVSDWMLVQAGLDDGSGLLAGASAFCAQQGWTLHRAAWSAGQRLAHVYARTPAGTAATAAAADAFARHCSGASQVRLSPLEPVFDVPGASAGEAPGFHYVVEMDPEAGWMDEISRWYDVEHMPGLAAVPGCIRALRFLNKGHGPLSLACYDLVTPAALAVPAWLAVRGSAWSDITRPHFTNTRRTMFEVPQH